MDVTDRRLPLSAVGEDERELGLLGQRGAWWQQEPGSPLAGLQKFDGHIGALEQHLAVTLDSGDVGRHSSKYSSTFGAASARALRPHVTVREKPNDARYLPGMSHTAFPDRRIVGFHQDDEQQWVAELECGHSQHVRHNPPWQVRPWVLTAEGRNSHLDTTLACRSCGVEKNM